MKLHYDNALRLERMERKNQEILTNKKIDFFSNISHELKTPLTLILSPLKMMIKDRTFPEEHLDQLKIVTKNAQRMLSIIDELITFSKIEEGQTHITVQQGEIFPFIEEICQIFKVAATNNDIHFRIHVDSQDLTKVWFSPPVLEKILYNLLSNAFKYTPSGGTILIKAQIVEAASGGRQNLKIEICDSGIGIPAESLDKIFDNYYQVNPIDNSKGYGIGLAFVKRLVEVHKGHISVTSALHEGTSFSIELGVSRESYTDQEISYVQFDSVKAYNYMVPAIEQVDNSSLNQFTMQSTTPKILIVEDNREMNHYLTLIFQKKFTVISAFDGQQGYELALKIMPDIIISDVMMPKMDGFQMTRKIKSEFLTCHIPVLLLTAKTTDEDTLEGFNYGADVYIKKPFDPERLELQTLNILKTRKNNIQKFKNPNNDEEVQLSTNPRDEKFLAEVIRIIKENIGNEMFSIEDISAQMKISRNILYVKLKNLADISASELVKDIRMRESKKRLLDGMTIAEAAYAVGISDPNYFSKCFKKQFGITPSSS